MWLSIDNQRYRQIGEITSRLYAWGRMKYLVQAQLMIFNIVLNRGVLQNGTRDGRDNTTMLGRW